MKKQTTVTREDDKNSFSETKKTTVGDSDSIRSEETTEISRVSHDSDDDDEETTVTEEREVTITDDEDVEEDI